MRHSRRSPNSMGLGAAVLLAALSSASGCGRRGPAPQTAAPGYDGDGSTPGSASPAPPGATPAPAYAASPQAAQTPSGQPAPCVRREGADGDVEKGVKTGGAAAKLGGKVAVEGLKTFGRAVGGLIEGGSEQARQNWREGADQTRATARGERERVVANAEAAPCADAPAKSPPPAK